MAKDKIKTEYELWQESNSRLPFYQWAAEKEESSEFPVPKQDRELKESYRG